MFSVKALVKKRPVPPWPLPTTLYRHPAASVQKCWRHAQPLPGSPPCPPFSPAVSEFPALRLGAPPCGSDLLCPLLCRSSGLTWSRYLPCFRTALPPNMRPPVCTWIVTPFLSEQLAAAARCGCLVSAGTAMLHYVKSAQPLLTVNATLLETDAAAPSVLTEVV